ncbi:MAG TPA: TetR/AcrR family transcriptional regulator [Myxococcota bacterium]|nr:TetR/AcrR family transcriptional regulator [Myxococcota bacterium]
MTQVGSGRKAEILDTAAALFASSGLRTSLQEIADACGILPGSLYHHFESKEDIFVALVERYQAELHEISEAAMEPGTNRHPPDERIAALGTAIAECAVRHRAALLLTLLEPPAGASAKMVRLASRTPAAINAAMLAILEAASSCGYLRREVDLSLLADRLCQSMLHVGIGVSHRIRGGKRMPAIKCWMLLHGLAVRPPDDTRLDRSEARREADEAIRSWREDGAATQDKAARIRAVARSVFARRGNDLTTIRDVVAASGMSTGTVYRLIESKDELMASILWSYTEKTTEGWNRIVGSASTPVEKLDALLWFNIHVVHRFPDEHRIQSLGIQLSPPKSPDLTWTFPAQLRQIKRLVSEGLRAGQLQIEKGSVLDMVARCVFSLIWTPESLVREGGVRGALHFDRDTLLRGAAKRS